MIQSISTETQLQTVFSLSMSSHQANPYTKAISISTSTDAKVSLPETPIVKSKRKRDSEVPPVDMTLTERAGNRGTFFISFFSKTQASEP